MHVVALAGEYEFAGHGTHIDALNTVVDWLKNVPGVQVRHDDMLTGSK